MGNVNEVKIFSYPESVHGIQDKWLFIEEFRYTSLNVGLGSGPPWHSINFLRVLFNSATPTALPLSISYSTAATDYTQYLYLKLSLDQDGKLRPNASHDIIMLKYAQTTALKSIKSLAPLLDRILVQRIKAETKTASGIFLPESSVKELNEAKVLAVGPGGLDKEGKRVTPSVSPGDKVLIPQVG